MTVLDHVMPRLSGEAQNLKDYLGQVVLAVNTASQCSFTPQYEGLETLYRKYRGRGFVVLGFPCNQFGRQERGDETEIGAFCQRNYGVSFPMFAKIRVNGAHAAPLYEELKAAAPGIWGTRAIKWNFTKFLIDRDGQVVRRYSPAVKPEAIALDIERVLARSSSGP